MLGVIVGLIAICMALFILVPPPRIASVT